MNQISDGDEVLLAKLGSSAGKYARFVFAALGGIPWIGGLIAAGAAFTAEAEQEGVNSLMGGWIAEHRERIQDLERCLAELTEKFDGFGQEVQERVGSKPFASLTRRAFQSWERACTEEKRLLVKNVLGNAGATPLVEDDTVRTFMDWIDKYSEIHFKVMRAVYRHAHTGIGREDIWAEMGMPEATDDSAEADLFKVVIRDLSTGGVIRQYRQTTHDGQFVKKKPKAKKGRASSTMKSPFDNREPYVLTELGKLFIHYAISDLAPRLGGEL